MAMALPTAELQWARSEHQRRVSNFEFRVLSWLCFSGSPCQSWAQHLQGELLSAAQAAGLGPDSSDGVGSTTERPAIPAFQGREVVHCPMEPGNEAWRGSCQLA